LTATRSVPRHSHRRRGRYSGHAWVYDPDQQTWREHHQPVTEPEDLERQLADRVPAVRDWVMTFETTTYLESVGLTRHEIEAPKALLRP